VRRRDDQLGDEDRRRYHAIIIDSWATSRLVESTGRIQVEVALARACDGASDRRRRGRESARAFVL
jgi:hypothetical protein